MLASQRSLDPAERVVSSSRLALVAGFGGLLLIMTLAGVDALLVLRQFRNSDEEIRTRYLSQSRILNGIRSDLYVSGTYVRDYLLEPDPGRAAGYRNSLEETRKHMEAALEAYRQQANPAEAQHYSTLQTELTAYWEVLSPTFHWSPEQRHQSGYAFLRDEVFPRRQNMLAVADRIALMNDQQLAAGDSQAASLLQQFQTRVLATLIAALLLGAAMAFFTTSKILHLEDQAVQRYREVAEARGQLKDLSARLVQAQEIERRALSRELHDEVGQSLSAVLVELRNLAATQRGKPADEGHHLETAKGLVENSVRVIRNMALLLRPSMLDDLGLIPALKWQAREMSKRTPIDVAVMTELDSGELDSADLPDEYRTCIYRVVQEALHNCARHSHAESVHILLKQHAAALKLTIEDDGQGFDANHVKGLGLLGIQERVTRLGGTSRVRSAPGTGTTIVVELPFSRDKIRVDTREADPHPVG